MKGAVTVLIAAPADTVWGLVTDVTRIGEFSPETFEARWVSDPPGPRVNARFRGHVRRNGRGPVYWTDCRVLICQPPHVFGFGVYLRGRLVNAWTYELRTAPEGTVVTESFALRSSSLSRLYWKLAGRARARTNERGMRQTLARIKTVAETSC